jgi:methionyl-tRNA formyltransferase
MNPSVAILGRLGSSYTDSVVDEAFHANLPVSCILLQEWGRKQKWRRLKTYVRSYGLLTTVSTKMIEQVDHRWLAHEQAPDTPAANSRGDRCPIFEVPTLNGKTTQRLLDQFAPTVVMLAGVGIVNEAIISRAQKAVINAHPGLVPKYKGNYVVRWAVLNGDEVGITVHFVDSGIDTGAVLAQKIVALPESASLLAVEHFVENIRARELVAVTQRFLNGEIEPQPQIDESGYPTYSLMPLNKLLQVYWMLRKHKAGSH